MLSVYEYPTRDGESETTYRSWIELTTASGKKFTTLHQIRENAAAQALALSMGELFRLILKKRSDGTDGGQAPAN